MRGDDMPEIDYSGLDPGIRETVRRLRAAGFETTDSGDGRSKLSAGYDADEILPYPHVVIHAAPDDLVCETRRLRDELVAAGILVAALAPDGAGASIQASYDPGNDVGVIMLCGVDDSAWPATRKEIT